MSLHAERHQDAAQSADQPDERLTVSQWHHLLIRCASEAWRKSDHRVNCTPKIEHYVLITT